MIASDGKARLPLPLQFSTSAENLNLGKLSDLKLALDLKVPREDYLFPDYKLELRQLGGDIKFDLPPQSGTEQSGADAADERSTLAAVSRGRRLALDHVRSAKASTARSARKVTAAISMVALPRFLATPLRGSAGFRGRRSI